MATAEILVVPSNGEQEGFGLVVAEGMALGTPIVASDIQVFREVLGKDDKCGWFFEKKNPESLAKTICQVFSQREEAITKANNALIRVQERFSIERMVKDYLRLYEMLVQNVGT
jgi:glycosyltransferase involved in cell wall biosynthesis